MVALRGPDLEAADGESRDGRADNADPVSQASRAVHRPAVYQSLGCNSGCASSSFALSVLRTLSACQPQAGRICLYLWASLTSPSGAVDGDYPLTVSRDAACEGSTR
jgi:hypothetical protein